MQIQDKTLAAKSVFQKDFYGALELGCKVATEGFEILVRNHGHDLTIYGQHFAVVLLAGASTTSLIVRPEFLDRPF